MRNLRSGFLRGVVAAAVCSTLSACGGENRGPAESTSNNLHAAHSGGALPATTLTPQNSGFTDRRVFGISPVDEGVVWASASGGTWLRTVNGGSTWETGVV